MKKVIIFGVILFVAIVLICFQSLFERDNKAIIKIGAVISLTGDASPWGEYAKKGMDLAVESINKNGGINGRNVEIVYEDDHTDPKQAVSSWNKLSDIDKVQGIIGGVFDFTAQPLIPLAESRKIGFISPSNFRIEGGFELNQNSFVMLTDFDQTIMKLKPFIESNKIDNLAVVHFKSTFGTQIYKTLNKVMNELGRHLAFNEQYAKIGNNDFRTTIIKLKSENVDAVFIDAVADDPLNFIKQSTQLGFRPVFITYNGALDAFTNIQDKKLLEGVVILNWEISTPYFNQLFKDKYNIEATKSADKYFDAVYVMANAIANTNHKDAVSKYIESNTFSTPNGQITFKENHSVKDLSTAIQVYKDGKLQNWPE